jgi:hypothetical protein
MTGSNRLCAIFAVLAFAAAVVLPGGQGEDKKSAVPQTPEWKRLTSLVGEWEGVMEVDGRPMQTKVEIRMTGDGSAIMHLLDKDSPHEMVTMIHPDGKRLLATHYCAAHNQPRMATVPSKTPNQIEFQFVDGTNIGPGEGYMKGVAFTFIDADHHEEAWTYSSSPTASIFKYTRKKN